MTIRNEHIIYTEEQIRNLVVFPIPDDDPEGPHLAQNADTGEIAAFVRQSFAAEDERAIRQDLEILRFNWLEVLGYDYKELEFEE